MSEEINDKRIENDFYPTPQQLIHEIVQWLARTIPAPSYIIEPSAGMGGFVYEARMMWPDAVITAVDIDARGRESCLLAGANEFIHGDWPTFINEIECEPNTLILGNPPFSFAEEHVRAAMNALQNGSFLAFLLRLNFYGARCRVPFWKSYYEKSRIDIIPRPNFKKGKNAKGKKNTSDNSEYGIFLWEKGFVGKPTREVDPIVWKGDRSPQK